MMMKTYARVQDGVLAEIIEPAPYDSESPEWEEGQPSRIGMEISIENRFTAELVATMVDITDADPQPQAGWVYENDEFSPPKPYMPSAPEILAANSATRDSLLSIATLAIAPLQDAVDLDDATPAETALLKKWKQYRVAVNRIDLTQLDVAWPSSP